MLTYMTNLNPMVSQCMVQDGFSLKILWLEASDSNNDPKIIAGYYLNYVKRIGGVPRRVRADDGRENVLVRDLQTTLRFNDVNPMSVFNSYQTGRSTSNQRIERFGETYETVLLYSGDIFSETW